MKGLWKRAALALGAAGLSLALAGCSLPMTGFADYDVSGYFQALLDSSYKGQNAAYIEVAATTQENAEQNNTTTVRNAAVHFCNTYGVNPSDEQLSQLEEVMRQALAQTRYTVREERKVETGYTLEVEIDPIVSFSGLDSTIDRLREEAQEEATQANGSHSSGNGGSYGYDDGYDSYDDSYDDSYGYDDGYGSDDDDYGYDDGYGSYDDSYGDDSQPEEDAEPVDATALFVDKVVEYCQGQLASLEYSGQTVTITLEIRQTEAGELQLDTNQLDTMDQTVLQFHS